MPQVISGQTDKVKIWENTPMVFNNHSISNRTLAATISKHKISNFGVAGERCAAENNGTHELLLQEHLQEYSSDYSFLSCAAARREANVCQTFSKYSR